MKKEYTLDNSRKNIKFKIQAGSLTIYRDNIFIPTLYYSDQFEIQENDGGIKVKQNKSKNSLNFNKGIVINSICGSSIVIGNNVVMVDGKVISGNEVKIQNFDISDNDIKFVVPNNVDDFSFDINIDSGNLDVSNLVANNMEANISSGVITMRNVDILDSDLSVMSGNIDLEISQSIINYETRLKAMCGNVSQNHIDTANNISEVKKRKLNAHTMSGNIRVLFKW